MIKKGYVTFVNNNKKYIRLTDILIESILLFSKYEVEIFSINFDYKYKEENDKIIYRKIICDDESSFESIAYNKFISIYDSFFDYGIFVDSDCIITPNTDILFEYIDKLIDVPLAPYHPSQYINEGIKYIMRVLDIKKDTQPYVHNATFLFSNSCKKFFKECHDVSQYLLKNKIRPINADETIMNVMLWKYEKTNSYIDCYDPYYKYFTKEVDNKEYEKIKVNKYVCHGCKDYLESEKILEKIKNNYSYICSR